MSAPRVIRSDPAIADLDGIWDYLAREVSPEVADFVIARLYEAMYRAAETPQLHRVRTEYRHHPRRINVYNYAIFYDPLPEGDGIFVWRVVHGARDLHELVFRSMPPTKT
jgi:plasmid stabilization system protein ParE